VLKRGKKLMRDWRKLLSVERSANTRVSLVRISYNATDKYVPAVRVTRTVAYECWLLNDFSDQCEDMAP
jgi:hypothetical protein